MRNPLDFLFRRVNIRSASGGFDEKAYFNDIARSLYKSHAFKTYDTAKGTPHPDWPEREGGISGPGVIAFMGDSGYRTFTLMAEDFQPDAKDLRLRIMSIRRALDTCVEQTGFAQFTRHFCEHLGQRAHQNAINRVPQMRMDSGRYTSQEVIEALETARAEFGQVDKRAHNSDVIKERLQFCSSKEDCQNYPELMASLLILQGAHQAFHTGLREAIQRNRKIPKDEKANADCFLSLVREGFVDVGAFQFLLPLIQAENQRIAPEHEGEPPHSIMRQAISGAWSWFDETQVLFSESTKEKVGTAAVCPANNHLAGVGRNKLIEHIYAGVVAHADDPAIQAVTEKVLAQSEHTEAMKMRRCREAMEVAETKLVQELAEQERFTSAPIPSFGDVFPDTPPFPLPQPGVQQNQTQGKGGAKGRSG